MKLRQQSYRKFELPLREKVSVKSGVVIRGKIHRHGRKTLLTHYANKFAHQCVSHAAPPPVLMYIQPGHSHDGFKVHAAFFTLKHGGANGINFIFNAAHCADGFAPAIANLILHVQREHAGKQVHVFLCDHCHKRSGCSLKLSAHLRRLVQAGPAIFRKRMKPSCQFK